MYKNVKAFFATKITRQVRELYLSVLIVNLAVAMVAIFEPIYLYKLGFSLNRILYFYIAVYAIFFALIPLGAKFSRRFGYEKGILVGSPFLALYYISLFLIPWADMFIVIAVLSFALQKTFYWPGFHGDFARFGHNKERGREMSNLLTINSFVYILGPFIGGLFISLWGFKILFIAATILILASNLPLLSTPEKFKPVPFSYKRAYVRLFRKENRRNFLGFLGFGEEFLAMVIWPVFIFTILKNFLSIGSLVALATLTTTLISLFVGKLVDGGYKHRRAVLKIGSVFSSAAWFMRLLVSGTLGVFLTDSLARTSKNVVVIPMMAMTYERAGDTSVMKTMMFFEMSLIAGKLFAMGLSLVALIFFPNSFMLLFIIGALMTLLYSLIKYEPIDLEN